MNRFLNNLFGVELVKDLGTVDITKVGWTQHITRLSIIRQGGKYYLEVKKTLKRGWVQNETIGFQWLLSPQDNLKLIDNLSRILSEMQASVVNNANVSLWKTISFDISFLLLGYRRISDLDKINLFDGEESRARIIKKDGLRFLYISTKMFGKVTSIYLPEAAIKAILAQAQKIPIEYMNNE